MNKALKSNRVKWKFTRSGKRQGKRIVVGHSLAAQVAFTTLAQINAIKSMSGGGIGKSLAIATSIIDGQIAMNKALRWWM
ncbi:hypothetical protein JLT2_12 [Paraglaciecola Antarctic JLT virus 2]|nr:hypothetical protein JLT2_12 [Paraglaciecola Antarctic JLT virus 2]